MEEYSPVGSSQSNGVVEAIQSVEGQMRVVKNALESRWGVDITGTSCVGPVPYTLLMLPTDSNG